MDEVNAMIAANAEQEELVDQPEVEKGVTRVSGPFTVEAVMPAEQTLDAAGLEPSFPSVIAGAPEEELETFDPAADPAIVASNAEAFIDRMLRYLRADGVRFPDNRVATFVRLDAIASGDVVCGCSG